MAAGEGSSPCSRFLSGRLTLTAALEDNAMPARIFFPIVFVISVCAAQAFADTTALLREAIEHYKAGRYLRRLVKRLHGLLSVTIIVALKQHVCVVAE